MKKETQTQIMKPIKVLSLVLLALLLLVSAASAETYTLIDTDLTFGGSGNSGNISGGSWTPSGNQVYGLVGTPGEYPLSDAVANTMYNGFDSALFCIDTTITTSTGTYVDTNTGVWLGGERLLEYTEANQFPIADYAEDTPVFVVPYMRGKFQSESIQQGGASYSTDLDVITSFCDMIYSVIQELSALYPNSYVLCTQILNNPGYRYIYVLEPAEVSSSTQHVTVTYDDETTDYTVTLERNEELSSAAVVGNVLGFIPIVHNVDTSSEDWSTTVSSRFLFFDLDYELRVELGEDKQSVTWNLDDLPAGATPPPEDTYPEITPPDTEPFDPTSPFPDIPFNPDILPEKVPTSVIDIIGFNKTEIKEDFKTNISFYDDSLDDFSSLVDGIFGTIFAFIALTLGFFLDPLSSVLTQIYDFISWLSGSFFSFLDFLVIPNHILSVLSGFIPSELVNLALVALGFDVLLNVFSIAIPDLISAYKSTIRTYFYKVDHGIKNGGKK